MNFATDLYPAFPVVWQGMAFAMGAVAAGGFGCMNYRLPARLGVDFTPRVRAIIAKGLPDSIWSSCDHCAAPLGWRGVVPVIGWLATRGRCPSCGSRVPATYPLMEIATGALAAGTLALTASPFLMVVMVWLVMVAWMDFDAEWIPDGFSIPLGIAGVGAALGAVIPVAWNQAVLGAVEAAAFMWVLQYGVYRLRGGGVLDVPLGDVFLFAALCAWTGPGGIAVIGMLSFLLGIPYALALLATTRRRDDGGMPFGPLLCGAGGIAILYEAVARQTLAAAFMTMVS